MRIDSQNRTSQVGRARTDKRKTEGGSTFSVSNDDAPSSGPSVSAGGVSAVGGLDALLALQAVEDPLQRQRKRAVQHGFDMLDDLDKVRLDLLSGQMPESRLQSLVTKVGRQERSGDEKLDSLLNDIELRARVELAKLEQARKT
ncbi:flagellar assembly protein FliX [Coralliovum pocilloporae]|uniref:flagellar assembly protein FliX n=1 Tax=Coralliovum pocilloporae TaxID=3066369 RepID=UPI00330789D1